MVPPDDRPNILLILSDEERRNGWLDGHADLPAHDRLRRDGLEFTRHFTHTSPCSPSRASLWSGRYLPGHGRPTRTAPAIHRSPSRADAHVAGDSGRINRKWRSRQTAHDGNRPKQPSCLRLTLSVYTDDATSRAFKGSRKARGEG